MSLTHVATQASRLYALLKDNAVEIVVAEPLQQQFAQAIDDLGTALERLNTGTPVIKTDAPLENGDLSYD